MQRATAFLFKWALFCNGIKEEISQRGEYIIGNKYCCLLYGVGAYAGAFNLRERKMLLINLVNIAPYEKLIWEKIQILVHLFVYSQVCVKY